MEVTRASSTLRPSEHGPYHRRASGRMKATGLNGFMARIDAAEYGLCCRLNRGAHRRLPRRIFQVASRLGDGVVWDALILVLPLLYRAPAAKPAIVMAVTGALGVVVYSLLKRLFVRERPF